MRLSNIQSVAIDLGKGSLNKGFANVTAQIIGVDNAIEAQFTGSLPAAPKVAECYQTWQSIYLALSQRLVMLSPVVEEVIEEEDELEIDSIGVTHVSHLSFEEACHNLEREFNHWLHSGEFLQLEQKLRSRLSTSATIRLIIQTNDKLVERLPWHSWSFIHDYSNSEIALSQPEYTQLPVPPVKRQKVRILAILGNTTKYDCRSYR